ncbi:T6SS immunity protein Tdi1 domain-containing protein [Antribacter gilvus]|uniref:T6SS immunity protein Tdi1 domain-containing protein n=1 Tax=Antribacter gilvus TaxID=2304675 RepID=UPI000F76CB36|nr:T6SS immunity protein Tdi1 domain-containing protein [Antribacter gilvus]
MHLIREFAPDAYEFALSSWSWLGVDDKLPRFTSCFGDMFLESADGWWFLDTVEGTLERCWDSMDQMFAELETEDGRAEYLLEETLNQAVAHGLVLAEDEVFAFLPPPAVTGTMNVDSLAPLRFAIAANLSGRIHGELRGIVPDGGLPALAAGLAPAQPGYATQAGYATPAGYAPQPAYAPPAEAYPGGFGDNGFGSNGFGDNGFGTGADQYGYGQQQYDQYAAAPAPYDPYAPTTYPDHPQQNAEQPYAQGYADPYRRAH